MGRILSYRNFKAKIYDDVKITLNPYKNQDVR